MSGWERTHFPIQLPLTEKGWELFGGTILSNHLTVVTRPTSLAPQVNTHCLPPWSSEYIGSETTYDGRVIAVIGKRESVLGIGLDFQKRLSLEEAAVLATSIVTTEELSRLSESIPDLTYLLALILSAKESTFKCLYPIVKTFFELSTMEITEFSRPNRTLKLRLRKSLAPQLPSGIEIHGHFAITPHGVHTLVGILPEQVGKACDPTLSAKVIPFRRAVP